MNMEEIVKNLINKLTDFDVNSITDDTPIEDLDLVSLDFVTMKVEIKRELDIDIDLNALAEADLNSFSELINYLENNYSYVEGN